MDKSVNKFFEILVLEILKCGTKKRLASLWTMAYVKK